MILSINYYSCFSLSLMMIDPNSRARKGGVWKNLKGRGEWCNPDSNRCKRVEWALFTAGLRMVAAFWTGICLFSLVCKGSYIAGRRSPTPWTRCHRDILLFVSYDSQGNDGRILTLPLGYTTAQKAKRILCLFCLRICMTSCALHQSGKKKRLKNSLIRHFSDF